MQNQKIKNKKMFIRSGVSKIKVILTFKIMFKKIKIRNNLFLNFKIICFHYVLSNCFHLEKLMQINGKIFSN